MAELTSTFYKLRDGVGHVTMAWSALEVSLSLIMAALMKTDDLTGMAVGAALDYPRKATIIKSLAELKLGFRPERELLSKFMSKVQSASVERGRVGHALWTAVPGDRFERMRLTNKGGKFKIEKEATKPEQLRKLALGTIKLSNEANEVAKAIKLALKK